MDYRILMDVSGDIIPSFAEEQQIGFLPMEYTISGENRVLHAMESPEILKKFYDGQRSGDLTQTTQITPGQYEEYFEAYLLRQWYPVFRIYTIRSKADLSQSQRRTPCSFPGADFARRQQGKPDISPLFSGYT